MKGTSIAVFGFVVIGLAVAGLIWMQYNANMGISEKLSSTDTLVFSRINEESCKVLSYAEIALGISSSRALDTVAKRGGWRNDNIRYWQCITEQVPDVSEVISEVNDETIDIVNSYLSLIEDKGDVIDFVRVDRLSCVNTNFSDNNDNVVVRGSGLDVRMSDGNSFVSSEDIVVEKDLGENNFLYDYSVLKDWVSDDVLRKYIEKNLNDDAIMPSGLSYESCSCSDPICPDAQSVADMIFPCWEMKIRSVVENAVDDAVRTLVNDNLYFDRENVDCDAVIHCISIKSPVIINEKKRSYDSDGCCSRSCTNCARDRCAIAGTEKICDTTSSESVCEKPDCEVDYSYKEYCIVSSESPVLHTPDEWQYLNEEEEEICETCCSLSFGLIYDTDVDLTLVCHDRSTSVAGEDGIEALEWRVNLFVSAISTTGADYLKDNSPGCG